MNLLLRIQADKSPLSGKWEELKASSQLDKAKEQSNIDQCKNVAEAINQNGV